MTTPFVSTGCSSDRFLVSYSFRAGRPGDSWSIPVDILAGGRRLSTGDMAGSARTPREQKNVLIYSSDDRHAATKNPADSGPYKAGLTMGRQAARQSGSTTSLSS